MLQSVLSTEEISQLVSKQTKALKLFGQVFNENRKWINAWPLKEAGFTLQQARGFNFNVSQWMWLNRGQREEGKKTGRPAVDKNTIIALNKHIQKDSTPASNRFLRKLKVCAMYRHFSIRNHYKTFVGPPRKEKLSYSSFYKYMIKKYKKPHRLTDMCKWCEKNKVI